MENRLKKTVLNADMKQALKLANSLKKNKVFKVSISDNLITIEAPIKENAGDPSKPEAGNWIVNPETGKIARFLIFECKKEKTNYGTHTTMRYNPDLILINQ